MAHLFDTLTTEALYLRDKLTGRKKAARVAAFEAFDAALGQIGPGQLAIDLGANVGEYTVQLAATGADVIAFEPDPHAFSVLSKAVDGMPNVRLMQAAAGTEPGKITLFRREGFDEAPDRRSSSSSIFADKRKMDAGAGIQVELVDFPAFVRSLDRDVALLKIDIEGAEVPLMEALLRHPAIDRIERIFIESHERVVRSLAARTRRLKAATATRKRPVINWDWH